MSGTQLRPHPLAGNQMRAVDPARTVWLSASAGTGKTQVLSARVLRLLLQPEVRPEQILCLTFTKAGAAEMAERIHSRLAGWVRADPVRLAMELEAIGADIGPETQARARTLFAAVLDCPGGGLRIDTIHAFSQWLLAAFPREAGLAGGARPLEDQQKRLLARQVLADLLRDAESGGDAAMLAAVEALALRLGLDGVEGWLMACASARSLWFGPGCWVPPLAPHVARVLGLPADADAAGLAALCADEAFDTRSLRELLAACKGWTDKKGNLTANAEKKANAIGDWLAAPPEARLAGLDLLYKALFTEKDEPSYLASLVKIAPDYGEYCYRVGERINAIREQRALLALAGWLAPALEVGRRYALAWDAAKAREGVIDFDDQIQLAADLLSRAEMADWIRYKLDRRIDHVLVDEAQDTNAAQWRIIRAMVGEFFSGEGARTSAWGGPGGKPPPRTLFVVGDYKQAIFGFQGTSPENFARAGAWVKGEMAAATANARQQRGGEEAEGLLELGLERSFRTARPVLDFVDLAMARMGAAQFGLDRPAEPHQGQPRPGYVALWAPVGGRPDEEEEDEPAGEDEGPAVAQNWLSRTDRQMAERLAAQVKAWLADGFALVKGEKEGEARAATPGDIMVLVRKRRDLAGLIVARLHAAGVPVAGVDRLRLAAPLAVRDLVAALRFAAQPLDDLNLASLLVSPLVGWSQAQLLAHGHRPRGTRLWDHIRRSPHAEAGAVREQLAPLLARADFDTVPALLQWLLVGPWAGRARLLTRLGAEAADPIEELVNAALAHAASATSSLAGFLDWFDGAEGELKREAGNSGDRVRVMTVHGSKGLQAPIVILADAAGDPRLGREGAARVDDPAALLGGGEPRQMPLPRLRKGERLGPIKAADAAALKAESEEHWRLLYVAMTRAEEALFIGGALARRETAPADDSWFARLADVAEAGGGEGRLDDPLWGWRLEYGARATAPIRRAGAAASLPLGPALPGWLLRAPAEEPVPPRPLSPSALGEDHSANPPTGMANSADRARAARRGTLMHKLLERLGAVPADARAPLAEAWLARQAGDVEASLRAEIAATALAVIGDARWADLFSPAALAEVPVAAVVAGQVIAGTIDRLLVEEGRIRLVDFKSARRPPTRLDQVPVAILRQMAAYAAALAEAFPGRPVEAALLYTQSPRLIEIPVDVLERHKAGLGLAQESLAL